MCIWVDLHDRPVRNAQQGRRQHCRCRTSLLFGRLKHPSQLRLFLSWSPTTRMDSLALLALLRTRLLRTHPFAPDAQRRPGETAVRTALSPRYLIRMRSQVQVLAGPPTIVAGQSAVGSEPGALAAGLGRAGAARPSPPEPPVAPPGPPTRAAASATTTHRGRAPSRGRQPGGGCRHLALQPAPAPTAPPPATGAPHARPGLPGRQRASGATAARTQPGGPGPPPTSHRPTRLGHRRPRPGLLERRSSRRRPGRHRGLHPFRWSRSPGHFDLVPNATA
jgi:hypothetical protein